MKESSESSLKSRALQSVKWNALSALSSVLVQVIRTVVLARMLDPRDYGLMAMMMVAMGIADAFVDAGLGNAIIHKQTEDRKVLSSLFWTNIGLGVGVYIVLAALVPVFVWYYKEPILAQLTFVLFTSVLFRSLGRQFEALLAKELKFKQIARIEMTSNVLSLFVAITAAWADYGVWALIWSQVSKVGIQGVTQFLLNWKEHHPMLHFQWSEVKPYVGFGLYQMGEIQIRYFAQRFDQMVLARFLGAISLGYYNFAYQLVQLPLLRINPVVTRVAMPVFAKIQNDTPKLQKYYLLLIQYLSLVNAPLLIAMGLFASHYVPLVFGNKWNDSILLIQLFSFVSFARSIGNPMGSLMLAKGKANYGFWINIALLLMNVPAILFGVMHWGAPGAIFALGLVQLFIHGPLYFLVVRPLLGDCGFAFITAAFMPLFYALLASVVGLTMMYLLEQWIQGPSFLVLTVSFIGFIVSYIVVVLLRHPTVIQDFKRDIKGEKKFKVANNE